MSATIQLDYSDFNDGLTKLMRMGDVRKRDIAAVFRKASRPVIAAIQREAPVSEEGVRFSRYRSRIHPRGNLRKSVKFKVSRKQRLAYFVFPGAWYNQIAVMETKASNPGTMKGKRSAYMGEWGWRKAKKKGEYRGKPEDRFVKRGVDASEVMFDIAVRSGLTRLMGKVWSHGG